MPVTSDTLRLTPLPALADNYIWVLDDGRQALVVDPGESRPVEDFLARENLTLLSLLITHHHGDHVGGVKALAAKYPDATIHGPATEAPNLPPRTIRVREGDTARVPALDLAFTVYDTPGHTLGHIVYATGPWLFSGDTMFASGCGRLFEGTPDQMKTSLDKLARLPPTTLVCCAHEYTLTNLRFARSLEPDREDLRSWESRMQGLRDAGLPTVPTRLADEHSFNPYLNADSPALATALGLESGAARPGSFHAPPRGQGPFLRPLHRPGLGNPRGFRECRNAVEPSPAPLVQTAAERMAVSNSGPPLLRRAPDLWLHLYRPRGRWMVTHGERTVMLHRTTMRDRPPPAPYRNPDGHPFYVRPSGPLQCRRRCLCHGCFHSCLNRASLAALQSHPPEA